MKISHKSADLPEQGGDAKNDLGSLTIEKMMSTEDAAEFLGLSVASLRNMTSQGQIPYYKLGRRNRYSRNELTQLLLGNRRGGSYGY